jgi:hypothetical protein
MYEGRKAGRFEICLCVSFVIATCWENGGLIQIMGEIEEKKGSGNDEENIQSLVNFPVK